MPKVLKKTRKPKTASDKGYCRKCQRTIALASNFYEATNTMLDTNGYMSICRDCCRDLYNHYFTIYNNVEIAINLTCRDLDICFNQMALRQTQSHVENLISKGKKSDAVFGFYKSKLSTTGKQNDGIDSFRYKDSDNISDFEDINESKEININTIDKSDFEITEDIVRYWGKGRDSWEYEFLQEEITKLKIDFECSDYGMEMIMKDICFINLAIERIRQKMENGDITKLIEARSKLMNDGNLKPVQSTGADKNEKMSLGVFIKRWENEKPISKTLEDEMKRYIDTYMVGHLAKMEGLNNEAVKKYEDAIKEYTIDFENVKKIEEEE